MEIKFSYLHFFDDLWFFLTGKGVFAGRDFSKEEFLLEYDGERISFQEGKNRLENYPDGIGSFLYLFNIKQKKCLYVSLCARSYNNHILLVF